MNVFYTKSLDTLRPPKNGRVWYKNEDITTLYDKDKAEYIKRCQFETLESAYHYLELWKSLNFSGAPSNYTSFFFAINRNELPTIKHTYNILLRNFLQGGWIEAFRTGLIKERVYLYDIKRAYYWSGLLRLPYQVGLYQKDADGWIGCFKVMDSDLLSLYARLIKGSYVVLTNEDVANFQIPTDKLQTVWLFGLYDYRNIMHLFERVYDLTKDEHLLKRICQIYWSRFAMYEPVRCVVFQNNEKKKEYIIKNKFLNLIWSILIVRRVMARIYEVKDNAILCYVDSVLTTKELSTGVDVGSWILKNVYDGVYVQCAGVWTKLNSRGEVPSSFVEFTKHAGYKKEVI